MTHAFRSLFLCIFTFVLAFTLSSCTEVESVSVTFDKNHDNITGDMPPASVKLFTKFTLPDNGFDDNTQFAFVGWGTTPYDIGTLYPAGAQVEINDSTVFYAKWSKADYVIKFYGSDNDTDALISTGGKENQQIFMPNGAKFRNDGYTFDSWKDSLGNTYHVGNPYMVTGDTNFYAQWTPVKYTAGNYDNFTTFHVVNSTQLADLAKLGKDFDNKTIILMNDIDMSGVTDFKGFQTEFKGTFEGDNKTIIDMTINVTAERTGFIATLATNGEIRNIHLVGGSTVGTGGDIRVGGIVGYNNGGTITNVSNTGSVTCENSYTAASVGGIVGYNNGGTITNASNSGFVTANDRSAYTSVGGIVGVNNGGTITNASNTGSVEGIRHAIVGGIVGANYGTITNASNTGSVTGDSSNGFAIVGGIVGQNYGTITNASNSGFVTGGSGEYTYIGGIVGDNYGTITNASNSGFVTGNDSSPNTVVGGIVGWNYGTITNASNTGSVTCSNSNSSGNVYVGGIVGVNNTDKTTSNVYNIGSLTVTSGTPKIGGVVGWNDKGSFDKAYYLSGVAGNGGGTADTLTSKDKDNFTVSALAFDPTLWENKTFTGSGIINGVATRAVIKGFEF